MGENYIVINGKRVELTKEQIDQLGIEVEEDKRWRAKTYEIYWHVDSYNNVEPSWDANNRQDDFRYYFHNYFRTKEEAETYARVLKTEMLLKKYADEHNKEFKECKYELYLDEVGSILVGLVYITSNYGHTIWFSATDVAENVIKEIGEERIREYLEYEW